MSESTHVSPLLDGFALGNPIREHHGIRCHPAIKENTDKKYIVKIISIPASQVQMDALLLAGGNDRDRKKTAEAVAMSLLCENREKAPCGKCRACVKVKAGTHPDLSSFSGTEKAHTVGINVIREGILPTLYIAPNEAQKKVYLLHDADGMTREAQNAFLKTLEEPPPFVSFVLAASGTQKLLSTVLSRCTTFSLGEKEEKEGAERDIAAALAIALTTGSEFALIQAAAPL